MQAPDDVDPLLSIDELALTAGVSRTRVARLVALGIVDPVEPDPPRFSPAIAIRLRRMFRLHRDLGVNIVGTAIILDLLDRLERMESDLASLPHGM